MIEVGNIVTLDNNQEFLLLEEIKRGENTYMYGVKVQEEDVPTDEFVVFEAIINGENEEFLKIVSDENLYNDLEGEFKQIIFDQVADMNPDGFENDEEVF